VSAAFIRANFQPWSKSSMVLAPVAAEVSGRS